MDNAPFNITREEVLGLAAQKLVDVYCGDPDLSETAERMIKDKVNEAFASKLSRRIDEFLTAEMERLLGQEIVPVNIWGERDGKATTLRAAIAERARIFWDVKIDGDGRECSYGGQPRSRALMEKILKDEFANAVKSNADLIIGEFKAALKTDATKLVTEHIDKLITVKSR